jgi:hypothetical protein
MFVLLFVLHWQNPLALLIKSRENNSGLLGEKQEMRTNFFDQVKINSNSIKETDEGYLIIPANFARTGIYDYTGNGWGHLYRDPKEVFDSESMETIVGKSLTITHPDEMVNPENWKNLEVGQVLSATRSDDFLAGDIIVKDKKTINFIKDSVKQGKPIELSCGYNAVLTQDKGTFDGKEYDGQQKSIRYNHIAIVPKGRAGNEVKLLIDSIGVKRMKVKFNDNYIEVDDKDVKIIEDAEKVLQDSKKKVETLEAEKKVLDAEKKQLETDKAELAKKVVTDADVEAMAVEIAEVSNIMDSLKLENKGTLKEKKTVVIDHFIPELKIKDHLEEDVFFDVAWKAAKANANKAIEANKEKGGIVTDSFVEDAEFEEDK